METTLEKPQNEVVAHLERAAAAVNSGRLHEAAGICSDLLEKDATLANATGLLGMVRSLQGDHEEGIRLLEKAIGMQSGVADWHSALCAMYRIVDRPDEAYRHGMLSVEMKPEDPNVLLNMGLMLTDMERIEDAKTCFLRSIAGAPNNADAHLALAQMLLSEEEYGPGWLEYEWRSKIKMAQGLFPEFTSPVWNGMRIPGGRILVLADQGYGDCFQFCRYLPLVNHLCAEVVVACSEEMVAIMKGVRGVADAFFKWTDCPPHAAHVSMSSLPMLFRTSKDTIPGCGPGYIFADGAKVVRTKPNARKVGLVWHGRLTHPNDKRRSVALKELAPLAKVDGLTWVSLQKPVPASDLEFLPLFSGMKDDADRFKDFSDTAAAIEDLDLVIAVDTGVAHLAAAMGKPVCLMVPKVADWRWGQHSNVSRWYPSVRIFRQPSPGDWASVVDAIASHLTEQ